MDNGKRFAVFVVDGLVENVSVGGVDFLERLLGLHHPTVAEDKVYCIYSCVVAVIVDIKVGSSMVVRLSSVISKTDLYVFGILFKIRIIRAGPYIIIERGY